MKIRLDDNSVVEVNLYFAEDGTKQELIDAKSELKISKVYDLKKIIEKHLNIPIHDQILLISGGINLKDEQLLSSYKKEKDLENIYLFSNKYLKHQLDESFYVTIPNCDPILKEKYQISYPTNLKENHPLTSVAKKFYEHYEQGKAILKASEKKMSICNKIINEIYTQICAFRYAYDNLDKHSKYIFREFDTFCAKFQKNKEYFNKLLSTFKDDVEHLKKTPLHPKLQTSTKKTLLDSLCDSDTKLIGYHQKCKDDFSKLHAKIEEGTKSKKEIQKEVSTRLSNLKTTPPLGINLDRLKSIKEEMEKSIENQKSSILVSIEKDYKNVERELSHHCSDDIVATYTEKAQYAEDLIKTTLGYDKKCKEIMTEFAKEKAKSTKNLFESLRQISKVQVGLKHLYRNISVYDSSMSTLKERFRSMEILNRVSAAVYLSYFEISRRVKYKKNLEKLVEDVKLKFKQQYEEEYQHRQKFYNFVGKYIPPKLISGLKAVPPSVKIEMLSSLDDMLPSIEMTEDLDKNKLTKLYHKDFSEEDVIKMYSDFNENELLKKYNTSTMKDSKSESYNFSISLDEELEKINKSKIELLGQQLLSTEVKHDSTFITSQDFLKTNDTINELREQIESITRQLKETKKTTKQEEEKEFQNQIEKLKKEYESQIEELKEKYENQIEKLKKEQEIQLKQLEELMSDEKAVIMKLEENLKKSDLEKEEMTKKMNLELDNIRKENEKLQKMNLEYEQQLSETKNQLKTMQEEIAYWKMTNESINEQSKAQTEQLKSEIEKLQGLVTEREELNKKMEQQNKEKMEEMSKEFELKLQAEEKKREELEKQFENLINTKDQIEVENENLKKEIEIPKKEILSLKDHVKMLKDKNEELKNEVKKLVEENSKYKEIMEEYKKLRERLDEQEKFYEIILNERDELTKTIEKLKKEKSDLELENQQLISESMSLKCYLQQIIEAEEKYNQLLKRCERSEEALSESVKVRRGRGRGGMKTRPPRRERLVRSEYAWKGAVAEGDQKILEDTQEILNKITPEKYATLKQQLLDLTIPNQDILKDIIFLIYEKAAKEPAFSHLYADLCKDLSSEGEFAKDNVFRKILLNKCQQEFEGFPNLRKELEALDKSTDLSEEDLLEKKLKIRLRMTGNMTFIGELFKRKMLSHKIMHEIIKQLLIKPDENQYPNEDEIETLCTLLDSIGKQLYIGKAKKYVDFYFQKLKEIASKRELYPARTRFKILDVIENREKGWPEKEELSTKTREEVRKQAIEEEKEKERAARKALRGRGGYSERGRARGRARGTRTGKKYEKVEEKEEDGWSTVGKKKTVRIQGRQKEEDLRIETRNAFSALEVDEISTPKTPETPPAVAEEAPKIDIEQQTTSIMNAFYDDRQKDDAIESLKDLKLDDYSQVLQKMLSLVMDKKDQDRSDTCSIISGLFDEKLVTPKEIAKAFEENIVDAQVNQLYFDIPKFFTWSGQMLGRLIGDKILSFNDIPSILKPVADKGLKAKGMSECIAGIFDSIKSEYLLLEKDLSIIPSLVASSTFNPLKLINPSEQKDVYTLLDKMESAKVSDLEPVCYIMSEIKKGESADAIKQWIKKISKDRSNISRKVASAIISIIEVSTRLEPRATNFEEKEKEMFEKYAPILIEFSAKVEIWSELHYFVHQAKKDKLMITIASLLKENKVLNKDSFNAWKKDKRDTIPEKTKFVKEVESLFA